MHFEIKNYKSIDFCPNFFKCLCRFDEESPERDSAESQLLVILIDDIHRLNPLDSDIVAALSWLPINLPRNVHIIGTTHSSPDVLKLTPVQRERFKLPECYIELPPVKGVWKPHALLVGESYFDLLSWIFSRKVLFWLATWIKLYDFLRTYLQYLSVLGPKPWQITELTVNNKICKGQKSKKIDKYGACLY